MHVYGVLLVAERMLCAGGEAVYKKVELSMLLVSAS